MKTARSNTAYHWRTTVNRKKKIHQFLIAITLVKRKFVRFDKRVNVVRTCKRTCSATTPTLNQTIVARPGGPQAFRPVVGPGKNVV